MELTFRVRAEYESAIKCREELQKVDAQLKALSSDASPEKVAKLVKEHAELSAQWENHMSYVGKASAYAKQAFDAIRQSVKDAAGETKEIASSTNGSIAAVKQRLAFEQRVAEVLEFRKKATEEEIAKNKELFEINNKRYEKERAVLDKKYNYQPVAAYSDEDKAFIQMGEQMKQNFAESFKDSELKLSIYNGLLEESQNRSEELKKNLTDLQNIEFSNTSLNDINKQIEENKEKVTEIRNEIKELNGTKSEIELEIKTNQDKIDKLTDVDAADQMLIANAEKFNEQAEITQRLTEGTEELIKKESDLIAQEGLLEQQEEFLNEKLNESTERFNSYMSQLEKVTEGTEEYAEISAKAESALAESVGYENELDKIQEGLKGVNNELKEVVEQRIKMQGELASSQKQEGKLIAEHNRLQKFIDTGVENNEALAEAVKNKEEANERLAEINAAIGEKKDLLHDSLDKLTESEDIAKRINDAYKGFAESIDSQATKVFVDESIFRRYEELGDKIANIQSEIRTKVESGNFSVGEIKELQDELQNAQDEFRSIDKIASEVSETLGDKLAQQVSSALTTLYELNENVRKSGEEFAKAQQDLEMWKNELAKAEAADDPVGAVKAQIEIDGLKTKLDEASDSLSKFTAQQKDAVNRVKGLANQIKSPFGDGKQDMKEMEQSIDRVTQKAERMLKTIAGFAGISIGLSQMKGFFDQAMNMRMAMEDLETSTKIFLGSAEKAAKFNDTLKNYSMNSLFHYNELMGVSHQMLALGMNTEQAMKKIDQLANVAAATHSSLSNVVSMYTRAQTMGSVMNRQLVSWQNLGINVKQVLRDMGEDTSRSTVSFQQLDKVINQVTSSGGQFDGAQKEMLGNLSAELDTYKNKLELMFNEVGEKYEGVFVKVLRIGTDMADHIDDVAGGALDFGLDAANAVLDEFAENWRDILETIKEAIVVFGAYKGVMLAYNAYMKVSATITKLVAAGEALAAGATSKDAIAKALNTVATEANTKANQKNAASNTANAAAETADAAATNADTAAKVANAAATSKLSLAMKGLGASMLANPWVLAAAGVAALAVVCVKAHDDILTEKEAMDLLNDASKTFSYHQEELAQKERSNISVIQSKTASLVEQTKAYKELIAENEIFAKFSKKEIANMSSEQIDSLMSEEKAKKNEERIRNQVDAAKELQQVFAGKGAAWTVGGEDDKIDEVIEKYKLLPEYAEQLKSKIGAFTDVSDWTNKLVESSNKDLENFLKSEAETGIVEGIKKGFASPDVQADVSKLMSDYSVAIEKKNADIENEIAEARARIERLRSGAEKTTSSTEKANIIKNINSQIDALNVKLVEARGEIGKTFGDDLQKHIADADKKVEDLEHQVAAATGEKKLTLMAELKNAKDDRDTMNAMLKLIQSGKAEADFVINVTRNIENAEIGNESLVTIGKDYKDIDDEAQKVIDHIEETIKNYEQLGDKSKTTLQDMLSDANLTAEGIDSSFDTSISKVKKDVDELRDKLTKAKNENEKRKINLEIARKEEQLTYIEILKARLKAMAENPYNIKINLTTNEDSFFKRVTGIFNKFSQRAQKEGQQAEKELTDNGDKEERKTGKEWKAEQRKFLQERKKELEALLKTKLTQKEAEDAQKELDQINSSLKKGGAEGKKLLEQRAKRIADEQKYQDDMQRIMREGRRAREDAELAAIENDGERERKSREIQHRRTLEDIELQQDETYKKIYQQRKSDYEQSHQGMKYELTTAGQKGWRGVKEEALPNMLTSKGADVAADSLRKVGISEQQIASIKEGKASIDDINDAISKLDSRKLAEIGIDIDTDDAHKNIKALTEYLKGDVVKGAQAAERSILEIAGKGDIIKKIDIQFGNGNADMVARPMIDAAELVKKGWKDAGEGIATVFSSQQQVIDAQGKSHEVLFTPILPDGTILSPKEFQEYIDKTLQGAEDILKADDKKLVIAVDVPVPQQETYTMTITADNDDALSKIDEIVSDIENAENTEMGVVVTVDKDEYLKLTDELNKVGNDDITIDVKENQAVKDIGQYLHELHEQLIDLPADKLKEIQQIYASLGKKSTLTSREESIVSGQQNITTAKEDKQREERNREILKESQAQIQALRDYLKEYGSFEQKKLAITEEYEKKINDARVAGNKGEELKLIKEQQKAIGQKEIENITMGMDWNAMFSGVGNISKEMMKEMLGQLQAFTKSQQYRESGAENQEKVTKLIDDIRQYVGTENVSWQSLAGAITRFEESVNRLKELRTENTERKTAYDAAKARMGEAEKLKAAGKITEEEYNNIAESLRLAKEAFDTMSAAVVAAEEDVTTFGSQLNQASDGVKNFVSEIAAQASNMQGTWEGLSGVGDTLNNIKEATRIDKVLDAAVAKQIAQSFSEEAAKAMADKLNSGSISEEEYNKYFQDRGKYIGIQNDLNEGNITQEQADAQMQGFQSIAQNIIGKIGDVGGFITNSMSNIFSSVMSSGIGQIIGAIGQVAQVILSLADSIKNTVTSMLDSISELLRFEWLSDMINSILDSIFNLIDSVLDLPESIANAIGSIVENVGGFVDNVVGRIGSVVGISGNPSDWLGMNADNSAYEDALDKWGWILDTWKDTLEYEKKLMSNYYGGTYLEIQKKSLKELEAAQEAAKNIYRGWHESGAGTFSHSHGYGANDAARWDILNTQGKEYVEKINGGKATVDSIWDLWELDWEDVERLKYELPEFWSSLHEFAQGKFNEYIEAGKAAQELVLEGWERITTTTEDQVFDDFLNNMYNFANGAEDVMDDVAESWQKMVNKMVVNNIVGAQLQKELSNWYKDYAKKATEINEKYQGRNDASSQKQKAQELKSLNEEYGKLYQGIYQSGIDAVSDLREMGVIQEIDSEREQQSATANSIKNISYEQADSLIGIELAKQMILEQMLAIMKNIGGGVLVNDDGGIKNIVEQISGGITLMNGNIADFTMRMNEAVTEVRMIRTESLSSIRDLIEETRNILNNKSMGSFADAIIPSLSIMVEKLVANSGKKEEYITQAFNEKFAQLFKAYDVSSLEELLNAANGSWRGVFIRRDLNDMGIDYTLPAEEIMRMISDEAMAKYNALYGNTDWQTHLQELVSTMSSEDNSFLTIKAEELSFIASEHRDIAADSRDILAGMAIHVEEIRDGVVGTIVPAMKDMREDLNKVRKLVEAQ